MLSCVRGENYGFLARFISYFDRYGRRLRAKGKRLWSRYLCYDVFAAFYALAYSSAAISTLFSCVTSTYNSVRYRKNVDFKTVLPMICASLIFVPIAVYFSVLVSGGMLKILLGIVLIALSIYFIFFNAHIKIKPTCLNGILAGSLGGTLSGLFSTGGPPAVL